MMRMCNLDGGDEKYNEVWSKTSGIFYRETTNSIEVTTM
jgi:hypothetical protein